MDHSAYYSPYSFLARPAVCAEHWLAALAADVAAGAVERFEAGGGVRFYLRQLAWDSAFFQVPTWRVEYTEGAGRVAPVAAFHALRAALAARHPQFYLFAEVPAEDSAVLAGASGAGWRLIETRLTWFRDDLQRFVAPARYPVRAANLADIPALRRTAVEAVNRYDRFHADDFFTPGEADRMLAAFIDNSVAAGFADEVIVPASGAATAFLTGNYVGAPPFLPGRALGKMVLSAVLPERRGWYVKLICELSSRFQQRGLDTAFMTTQATNHAVLRVWTRLGYRFGRCTHLFSTYQRNR